MTRSGVVGLGMVALAIGAAISWGGLFPIFFNIPSAVICVAVPAGLGIAAFGLRDFFHGIGTLRFFALEMTPDAVRERDGTVIRGLIPFVYASGVLGTLIGVVQMLATLDDPAQVGAGMAVALLTVLYAVVGAECFLRPTLRHIEHTT